MDLRRVDDRADGALRVGKDHLGVHAEIERALEPSRHAVDRLTAIPGLSRLAAGVVGAEIGVAVERFPAAGHLLSWAGMCPTLDESGHEDVRLHALIGLVVDRAHVDDVLEIAEGVQFALIKGASHMAPWTAIETLLEVMTTFIETGTIPREEWES